MGVSCFTVECTAQKAATGGRSHGGDWQTVARRRTGRRSRTLPALRSGERSRTVATGRRSRPTGTASGTAARSRTVARRRSRRNPANGGDWQGFRPTVADGLPLPARLAIRRRGRGRGQLARLPVRRRLADGRGERLRPTVATASGTRSPTAARPEALPMIEGRHGGDWHGGDCFRRHGLRSGGRWRLADDRRTAATASGQLPRANGCDWQGFRLPATGTASGQLADGRGFRRLARLPANWHGGTRSPPCGQLADGRGRRHGRGERFRHTVADASGDWHGLRSGGEVADAANGCGRRTLPALRSGERSRPTGTACDPARLPANWHGGRFRPTGRRHGLRSGGDWHTVAAASTARPEALPMIEGTARRTLPADWHTVADASGDWHGLRSGDWHGLPMIEGTARRLLPANGGRFHGGEAGSLADDRRAAKSPESGQKRAANSSLLRWTAAKPCHWPTIARTRR